MTSTKTLEAKGTVWQEDDDHPSGNGGYQVAAEAVVVWVDADELTLEIHRADEMNPSPFYMSPDQAKDLIVAIAAALADTP